jgi:hypothetical protein
MSEAIQRIASYSKRNKALKRRHGCQQSRGMNKIYKLELQNPHPDYQLDDPRTCGVVGVPSAPDKGSSWWIAIGECYPAGLLTGFNAAPM